MNFYQRANLSLSLAVILGFEVGAINLINNDDGNVVSYLISVAVWVLFQIALRTKLVLDDHAFFETDGFLASKLRALHFFSMMLSTLFFAIAAATSVHFEASAVAFSIGLAISTLWVVLDLITVKGSSGKLFGWILLNFLYIGVLLSFAFEICVPGFITSIGSTFSLGKGNLCGFVLFVILFFDFWYSKSVECAPKS